MDVEGDFQSAREFVGSAANNGWFSTGGGVLLLRHSLAGQVLVSSLIQEEGTSSQEVLQRMDLQGNVLLRLCRNGVFATPDSKFYSASSGPRPPFKRFNCHHSNICNNKPRTLRL